MDPTWATILAPLIATIQTVLLMYAAYHWPTGRNEHDDERPRHSKDEDDKK